MRRKIDLTEVQATKPLQGGGVSLKYYQLHNGATTVTLDDERTRRFDMNRSKQIGYQLRLSPQEAERHLMSGDGVFKYIREEVVRFFSGAAEKASPAVRRTLQSADQKVIQAWMFRTPLNLIIKFVLLHLSNGKFEDKRRELNANDVYHVGFIFALTNGKTYRVEKNAVVEVTEYQPRTDDELLPIGLAKHIPMQEWISNAESKHGASLFQYSPGENNCSLFAEQMLGANPVSSTSLQTALTFVHQESEQLFNTLSEAGKTFGNVATNLAARVDRVIGGDGIF